MDSRLFIAEAKALVDEIKVFSLVLLSVEEEQFQGQALQKRLNQTFSGLQNNTLNSAFVLRDVAVNAGFHVEPRRLQLLGEGERCWPRS
jgi:hypothetical protein